MEQSSAEAAKIAFPSEPVERKLSTPAGKMEPANTTSSVKKTMPPAPVRYLDRQLQRAKPAQTLRPLPLQNPPPKSKLETTPDAAQKNEGDMELNSMTPLKTPSGKEKISNQDIMLRQLTVDASSEEKEKKKPGRQASDELPKIIPDKPVFIQQKTEQNISAMLVPANTRQESVVYHRKTAVPPKLSIGRITVEVVSPAPKVQTTQRTVQRITAPSAPKSGYSGANKLIFGFGQM